MSKQQSNSKSKPKVTRRTFTDEKIKRGEVFCVRGYCFASPMGACSPVARSTPDQALACSPKT